MESSSTSSPSPSMSTTVPPAKPADRPSESHEAPGDASTPATSPASRQEEMLSALNSDSALSPPTIATRPATADEPTESVDATAPSAADSASSPVGEEATSAASSPPPPPPPPPPLPIAPVFVPASAVALDDFIQSPDGHSEIVERSPGGRYVRFAEKLGSGASKDVFRAYDTQEGIEVAWNVVNLSGVPKSERNRIVNEVRLLERLHHHNIISFHGSWVNRERQEVNFVTEILSSGTLKSFINKVQVIRWKIAKRWAAQILQGLHYLHSQDPPVIHRDLKCENIFINGTSGDLRIGDLGLSTVHRNGRVLSVLGTPEFMAPDMYEEEPYDEKVDIYAFGMCLLEIFTKEIPYRECMNPAQIYKKVTSGELPEVLSRLQSRNAREFILLCLGHKDEATGRYVRPSAAELLQHPFLEKRASDDDEVVVDPPLYKRVISEGGESQSSLMGTPISKSKAPGSVDLLAPPSTEAGASGAALFPDVSKTPSHPPPPQQVRSRASSLSDHDGDRFDEMPQSETQFRKVKVMMGRGRELEEEDDRSHVRNQSTETIDQQTQSAPPTPHSVAQVAPDPTPVVVRAPLASQSTIDQASADTPHVPAPPQQYLVAAAVLENESSQSRPYPDDVLKLVVTLPVEGRTQNVQFDFHLVEDDPVQVAKEMVQELGIPPGAVLEISETISGLACAARIKIEKFNTRNIQVAASQPGTGQSQASAQEAHSTGHAPPVPVPSNHGIVIQSPSQHLQQVASNQHHLPLPTPEASYRSASEGHILSHVHHDPAHAPLSHPGSVVSQQSLPAQMPVPQPLPIQTAPVVAPLAAVAAVHEVHPSIIPHDSAQVPLHPSAPNPSLVPGSSLSSANSQVMPTGIAYPSSQPNTTSVAAIQSMTAHPLPIQSSQGHAATATPHPQNASHVVSRESLPSHHATPNSHLVQPIATQSVPPHVSTGSPVLAAAAAPAVPAKPSQGQAPFGIQQEPVAYIPPPATYAIPTSSDRSIQPHRSGQSLPSNPASPQSDSVAAASQPSHARHQTSPDVLPVPSTLSQRVTTTTGTSSTFGSDDSDHRKPYQPSLTSPGQSPPPLSDDGESDTDPTMDEELRKLEEEFERSLQRAKKVFDSRMDNLQRSQIEREAQHQKTLEKHEKERAEFEKRLAQEEEQQLRRMEHLQREWEKKRHALARSKRRPSSQSSAGASNGLRLSQESIDSQLTIGSGSIGGGGLNPLSQGAHHRRQASGNTSSQTLAPATLDLIYQPPMNGGHEPPR